MKRFIIIISLLIAVAMLFASCGKDAAEAATSADPSENTGHSASDESEKTNDDTFDTSLDATGDFTVTPSEGAGVVAQSGTTYMITSGGEYTLSGKLEDGCVVVEAGEDDEVVLILSDANISSSDTAPIAFISAGEATVKSEEGTYNSIYDNRNGDPDSAGDDDPNGAIYADCDLKISGKGSLIVESSYDNGIKSKDDLKIKNVTLKVTSPGVALKGNDSVTVESGSLIVTSTGADGIKTSNSKVSSKGNQKGTVTISGGSVDIYAACDGISAAYDVVISEESESCTVNVYTASYSDSSGEVASSSELYVIVPDSIYDESTDYYACFYGDDGEGVWKKCEYETMVYSGWDEYYGLLVKAPAGYDNFLVNTVAAGETPDGENYTASSGGETLNVSMNGYLINSVSGGVIDGDWVTLTSGGQGGSSDKTTYSSKGIKSSNEINISGGTVTVYSMDDAIHANGGDELENGSTGAGNITVAGGKLTLTCADDGMHADEALTITGGYVNVVKSHEGLEANVVTIAGGEVFVYGEDDGINACKGSETPLVKITGGYLDVTTPGGDTDAVDSNGNIEMTGGFAVIKGGASMGSMAGSVDVDGEISVTGGTIIALGGICEVPGSGSVNYYVSNGTSFSGGEYALKSADGETLASFTLSGNYSSCWIASDLLELSGSYELTKDGSAVLSWTQSSQAAGDSVQGGFGGGPGGGPGGMGPGGRR